MKVVIIDDEPLARAYVRECLESHPEIEIVAECSDGFEGVRTIQNVNPDLIFLDIQMPKINGFEMLELLDTVPAVIFTTAYDAYAIKAFEANAIDYLLKPFDKDRFEKALKKILHLPESDRNKWSGASIKPVEEQNRIVLRHQGEIRIVPAAEILYIEAWDDYVKIHTTQQVYVKKQSLGYYENHLNKSDFVRCHRSFLVNVSHITALNHGNQELRLRTGFHLPVSRSGYLKLKMELGL